jgi:hypothetical protein
MPDGIPYQSRPDSGEICIALFERTDLQLQAPVSVPLIRQVVRDCSHLERRLWKVERRCSQLSTNAATVQLP